MSTEGVIIAGTELLKLIIQVYYQAAKMQGLDAEQRRELLLEELARFDARQDIAEVPEPD